MHRIAISLLLVLSIYVYAQKSAISYQKKYIIDPVYDINIEFKQVASAKSYELFLDDSLLFASVEIEKLKGTLSFDKQSPSIPQQIHTLTLMVYFFDGKQIAFQKKVTEAEIEGVELLYPSKNSIDTIY